MALMMTTALTAWAATPVAYAPAPVGAIAVRAVAPAMVQMDATTTSTLASAAAMPSSSMLIAAMMVGFGYMQVFKKFGVFAKASEAPSFRELQSAEELRSFGWRPDIINNLKLPSLAVLQEAPVLLGSFEGEDVYLAAECTSSAGCTVAESFSRRYGEPVYVCRAETHTDRAAVVLRNTNE